LTGYRKKRHSILDSLINTLFLHILSVASTGNSSLCSAQSKAYEVVPHDCGTVASTPYVICGSQRLQVQATAVGIKKQLHPVAGGYHRSSGSATDRRQIIAEVAVFSQALISPPDSLPVVLKSFEGNASGIDCTATLTWQTVSEQGSWAYEVQSSGDGQDFTTLGTVPSKNRLTGATYTYRAGSLPEARYFRLKLLDVAGAATYSPVVVVDAACTTNQLLIAPNPARDQATVRGLPPGRSQALLYNATGQCVASASGEGSIALPLSELPAGVYLLKAVSETGIQAGSAKLVKE
jgi:hypothetical protein